MVAKPNGQVPKDPTYDALGGGTFKAAPASLISFSSAANTCRTADRLVVGGVGLDVAGDSFFIAEAAKGPGLNGGAPKAPPPNAPKPEPPGDEVWVVLDEDDP